jgi:hypothetical protein
VPEPLLQFAGVAPAALGSPKESPSKAAADPTQNVALVSAQIPTDTNIPLIFVKR